METALSSVSAHDFRAALPQLAGGLARDLAHERHDPLGARRIGCVRAVGVALDQIERLCLCTGALARNRRGRRRKPTAPLCAGRTTCSALHRHVIRCYYDVLPTLLFHIYSGSATMAVLVNEFFAGQTVKESLKACA
jgi:hypothetical protein